MCIRDSGKDAQLKPIVSVEGKVTEVLVLNSGTEYNSPPQLSVYGEGSGCVLVPVMKSGRIDSVNVVIPLISIGPRPVSSM